MQHSGLIRTFQRWLPQKIPAWYFGNAPRTAPHSLCQIQNSACKYCQKREGKDDIPCIKTNLTCSLLCWASSVVSCETAAAFLKVVPDDIVILMHACCAEGKARQGKARWAGKGGWGTLTPPQGAEICESWVLLTHTMPHSNPETKRSHFSSSLLKTAAASPAAQGGVDKADKLISLESKSFMSCTFQRLHVAGLLKAETTT